MCNNMRLKMLPEYFEFLIYDEIIVYKNCPGHCVDTRYHISPSTGSGLCNENIARSES